MTDRKQEILDQIRIAIEEVWDNTPFPDIGLDYKIENGIALDKNEKEYFIRSEGWKMETLRGVLPYVLANLVAENPDIAELLAGKHVTAQANRDGNYTKTLLILDEKERFYVDLFYFPIWEGNLPSWLPFWGGKFFTFFNAIFNVADMAISTGVGILLVFNKKAFGK